MPFKDEEKKRTYQHAYFLANREKLLADMRERNRLPDYVAKRVAYQKSRAPAIARGVKAYRKRHPEEQKARWTLTNALRSGKLVKADACSKCGKDGLIDGHHPDYSKPLEVLWLCRRCHTDEHVR